MKISTLKQSNRTNRSLGFTLAEVLMAIAILGMTSTLISYAVSQMITSNKNLSKEQNRRVEATRALDLIASDIKISTLNPIPATSAKPIPAGITGTVILDMDLSLGDFENADSTTRVCTDTAKNRIIYSIKQSDDTQIGPNVIYRYGLNSNSNGKINCNDALPANDGDAIADAISIDNTTKPITAPFCGATASPTFTTAVNGFYTCTSGNQVSIALYTATQNIKNGTGTTATYTNTKTYGINRNVISAGTQSTTTNTAGLWCTVPNVVDDTSSNATTRIEAVRSSIDTTKTLRANAIRTEVSANDNIVISQSPAANTQIPCDGGLVTYNY